MTKSESSDLTFEEFRRLVAEELQVDEERVVPEASFFSDLCVDSIRMVDMMLRLEELGLSIPLEDAWQIETVEDAYQAIKG
jgi:acyl carrier protein